MIDEKNTAIITYIDEYFCENLENDFLNTLFNVSNYKGTVILLNYGIVQEDIRRLAAAFPIKVIECDKNMPVFSNRYFDIPRAIEQLDNQITHVATMDSGDIWFQNSIHEVFEICQNGIGCVEEERIIGEDHFTGYCLDKLQTDERNVIEDRLQGKKVKNSGVICGPKNMMRKIIEDVGRDMSNCSCEFFGVDQLYFNYEWYALEKDKRINMDETYNYVLVSNVDKFTVQNDVVIDNDGNVITVVHNAGANWRALKRPYKNKLTDEDQYTDVRSVR